MVTTGAQLARRSAFTTILAMRGRLKHFALGPILWVSADKALKTLPLEQTAWQRGIASAAAAFDQPLSPLNGMQAIFGAVVGVAGNRVAGAALLWQVLVGAGTAIAAYWAVPTA